MPTAQELYSRYRETMQQIADIRYASAVLQWDQETYIPPKGGETRGRQIATLNEMAHTKFTDEKLGGLLEELLLQPDLSEGQRRNAELTLEDYNKNKKLPAAFVRQLSETVNRCFHAWIEARRSNAFAIFEEPLTALVNLKKEEAALLGYEGHPYNALMNEFEKGATVQQIDGLFEGLIPQLTVLLDRIKGCPQVDNSFLHQHYDRDAQWKFGLELLKKIHFDFEAGRQDISEHPFTINFSSSDVRVTTRIDEQDFGNMTWSCLHEGGHALYEQGLPAGEYGLPLGEYCSLSIHESQSRLWENCVGRGLPFWQHNFSAAQAFFPQQLNNISAEQFYKAINRVQPSLIRTEADELTYHFHVLIRYELEKQLIGGSLAVKDLPGRWNELYLQHLGVTVPDDRQGCLQDVHWSHGSFGYFATYSLGSLYAAQLYAAVKRQNESLEEEIAKGDTGYLHQWLQKNIYSHGRRCTSEMLCSMATGSKLDTRYFIDYATKKYDTIYFQ